MNLKNKSSYMFFCVDCREEIKAENSGIDLAGRTNEKPNCLKILQSKFPNIQSTEGP